MRRLFLVVITAFLTFASFPDQADARPEPPRFDRRNALDGPVFPLRGASGGPGKAAVDTQYLYGGPGTWEGKFETDYGPDWMGWTHEDLTTPEVNHWHISTYYAANLNGHGPGNRAMWCGDSTLAACSPADSVGGVTSGMFDGIIWQMPAPDPLDTTTVRLTAYLNYDLADVDWDFLELWIVRASSQEMLGQWTGSADNVFVDFTTTVLPGEYVGTGDDQVKLRFRAWSDSRYDDLDCLSPSHGAAQIDDIAVYLNGSPATFDDFEAGSAVNWIQEEFAGVGDFASLRNNLGDLDPCRDNRSFQVTFIDDGLVVPGTGGTPCITWCYGPGGYIVNNTGGLLADDTRDWFIHNRIVSPPIPWISGLDAATYSFDVYRHEELGPTSIWPGMFFEWEIRSTTSPDPMDLESAPWKDRNFVFYGGPDYVRFDEPVSDLLEPDPRWVQLALGVNELGWAWGWVGIDGTPAPYFDNVTLQAWKAGGPEILLHPANLFADAFVESGVIDPLDPAANSCRLDISTDVFMYAGNTVADHGDSLIATVTARPGGALTGNPVLHWVLHPNPDYDLVRGALRGSVTGFQVIGPYVDRFAFDLPDTGFFYPGDILHYYITAQDDLNGDIGMSAWPADTTSVLDFSPRSPYEHLARVRALPTLTGPAGAFTQPDLLVVDSANSSDHTLRLLSALSELGFVLGVDFDLFTVNNPTSDDQQGLAGMAPDSLLAGYSTLLYDVGGIQSWVLRDTGAYTPSEPQKISSWLDRGGRSLLMSGNIVITDLNAQATGRALIDRLGVAYQDPSIADLNGGARDLQISPLYGNGILPNVALWKVNGGCPGQPSLDAISPNGGALAAASLDPSGTTGGPYAAVVAREDLGLSNRLLTVPFDLERVLSPAEGYTDGVAMSGRARLLGELLGWLGSSGTGVSPVPGVGLFAVEAAPNPFNPVTTLSYNLPQAGHLSLQVFDMRGRLVRSLIDEPRTAGAGKAVWDGRDDQGARVSSGVYFWQARSADQIKVGKITMIK